MALVAASRDIKPELVAAALIALSGGTLSHFNNDTTYSQSALEWALIEDLQMANSPEPVLFLSGSIASRSLRGFTHGDFLRQKVRRWSLVPLIFFLSPPAYLVYMTTCSGNNNNQTAKATIDGNDKATPTTRERMHQLE
ncbi:hypothetical protein FIBSPDRAFT_887694 [Athelia psychrophila]|uniref:Uncharacterized protein n=1 Tax=Athelia psychrophila TaxID=1759441 RepID=A0A166PFE6_9AGAM|nr:hypothetical protein FIBSPDRAFT_887694 [Fibularhizoctonia sp. CBS 109695]